MPWPRGSLLAALLILSASLASADSITVNTTTDDNAANSLCSLREAVEYFNHARPKAGYQGCVAPAPADTDVITLASDAAHPYLVATPIYVTLNRSLIINGAGATGDTRTIVKATGSNRIFIFSDNPVFKAAACGLVLPTPTCEAPAVAGVAAPHLEPTSDTETALDFLTQDDTPTFSGSISYLTATPDVELVDTTTTPGTTITTTTKTFIKVRLYKAAVGSTPRVELVSTVMPYEAGASLPVPTAWTLTATQAGQPLTHGDHSIGYTTQKIRTISVVTDDGTLPVPPAVVTVGVSDDESALSPTTKIRVYKSSSARSLTINLLELEGCAPLPSDSAKDCSANADLTGALVTDPDTGLEFSYNIVGTTGNGGIIFGSDSGTVILGSVVIHGGHASSKGGAVYIGANGKLELDLSEVRDNKADHGGALFVQNNALVLGKSLVTANKVVASALSGAAVVEIGSDPGATYIVNSTFSGNQGVALSLRDGVSTKVVSSTIVLNEGGINFNGKKVSVYNSIIAGNPDNFSGTPTLTECMNLPPVDLVPALKIPDIQYSVSISGGGCATSSTDGPLTLLSNTSAGPASEKLMAGLSSSGKCEGYAASGTFKGMGLLCPLLDNGGATRTHRIRLLPSYAGVSDSPLLTKGSLVSVLLTQCESTDQRAMMRHSPCDIGATESQSVSGTITSGGVMNYGQVFTSDPYDLGDEELFDPLFSNATTCPPQTLLVDQTKKGCPWLETAPTRGAVVFNADGSYSYTPASNFHGFDRFTVRVVTTLSNLNGTTSSKSRLITALVIVEPASGISSSSLGALDWELLFFGGLLGFVRRRHQKGSK